MTMKRVNISHKKIAVETPDLRISWNSCFMFYLYASIVKVLTNKDNTKYSSAIPLFWIYPYSIYYKVLYGTVRCYTNSSTVAVKSKIILWFFTIMDFGKVTPTLPITYLLLQAFIMNDFSLDIFLDLILTFHQP